MKIIWRGQSLFEIIAKTREQDEVKIVIDPYNKELGLRVPKLKADILLVTHDHYDHANTKAVEGSPFLIEGPGEYEVKGVSVKGIPVSHDNEGGTKRGEVTIYTIEAEDITLCHLADIGQKELTENQLDEIGEINILMIPVGGVYTVDAKEASHIVNQIEPQIVLPMHYKIPKLKEKLKGLDEFLKVEGVKNGEPLPKLNIKKRDMVDEKTKVIVLAPQ